MGSSEYHGRSSAVAAMRYPRRAVRATIFKATCGFCRAGRLSLEDWRTPQCRDGFVACERDTDPPDVAT